ncbi:MAG: cobalamin-dependent protein [Bacteroidota bacterium]
MKKTILSTADVARLFSVTETTVKRWADEKVLSCRKTPGGHRKFQVKDVVEFSTRHHLEPTGALELGPADSLAPQTQAATLERDFGALAEVFLRRALAPGMPDLGRFLSYLYQHHIRLWEICDLVVRPAMRTIGEMWARGEIGVSHEHRASYQTMDALAGIRTEAAAKPPNGRSVLCACLDEETHEIGLRCAAALFESEGWQVQYLGARTPPEAVLTALRELRPDVVCVSVTVPSDPKGLTEALRAVRSGARAQGAALIGGGQEFEDGKTGEELCDRVFPSARSLLDYIIAFGEERVGAPS